MSESDEFLSLAQDVAESIAGLAEPTVGGSRWRTLSYLGEPQHNPDIFAGTGGIPILFADLFAVTGETRYREIAESGALWIDQETKANLTSPTADPSLYFGLAGHGMTLLRLFQATQRMRWLDLALSRAHALQRTTYADPEILTGAAGAVIFLLEVHHVTGDAGHLTAAERVGDLILTSAQADNDGWRWRWKRRSGTFEATGFAHGASGIGYALGELHRVTQRDDFRDAALGVARWISNKGVRTQAGLAFNRYVDDADPARVQWCHGAPGIGLFAIRTFEAIGAASLRELAEHCAEATYAAGDVKANASQCHGLAGNGELLIEVARVLGQERWMQHAIKFGHMALAYREDLNGRSRWLSDEPGEYGPDFMTGSAGTGHFFLRLARPDAVNMPLMVTPPSHTDPPN